MLKVLPILIAVVAADAFGLSYTGYNKYLFDEFVSINNDVSFSRQRRGVKNDFKENKNIGFCCTGDKFNVELNAKLKEITEQCDSELNMTEPLDSTLNGEYVTCLNVCIYRILNLSDPNGKLDREAIIKFYTFYEATEWKVAALDGYVDECLTKVESTLKATDKQCSDVPLNYNECMAYKFLLGCPAELRTDNLICNRRRKYVEDLETKNVAI